MKKKAKTIFNPEAVYATPPEGVWVENLVDIGSKPPKLTGPMYVPAGVLVVSDKDMDDAE